MGSLLARTPLPIAHPCAARTNFQSERHGGRDRTRHVRGRDERRTLRFASPTVRLTSWRVMDDDAEADTTGSARLHGARAIVVGAGQTPGETIGNGRAIALTFAREGAHVLCVDREEARAAETVELIRDAGGTASALRIDISDPAACLALAAQALEHLG